MIQKEVKNKSTASFYKKIIVKIVLSGEYCHGGCTVDALSSNGDINSKYYYCESYKRNSYIIFMTEGSNELKKSLKIVKCVIVY